MEQGQVTFLGMGQGGGWDENSGDVQLEVAQSFFRPGDKSPSEMSLEGGTLVKEEIIKNKYRNSELVGSGDTGLVFKTKFLEEGTGGICGAAVDGVEICFL